MEWEGDPPAFSREPCAARMAAMARNSFRVRERLAVRRSGIHGKGVFARELIPAGTRLIEYTGERITQEEGDRRYPWDDSVPYHTLLFTVEDDLLVDGGVRGNLSRYINHSCDPNCASVIEERRIYIDSIREILPGEELTFDYRMIIQGRHTPAEKRRFPCGCGAAGCRGTMLKKKR
jgi:SET domain-containing protein